MSSWKEAQEKFMESDENTFGVRIIAMAGGVFSFVDGRAQTERRIGFACLALSAQLYSRQGITSYVMAFPPCSGCEKFLGVETTNP